MKQVKKGLIVAFALFALAACSEEEPTTTGKGQVSSSASVIGEWTPSSLTQSNGTISINGTQESTYSSTTSNLSGTWKLNEGNTFQTNISYDLERTVTTDGSESTINRTVNPRIAGGSFEHNSDNNTLTVTFLPDNDVTVYTITELSSSSMTVVGTVTSSNDDNGTVTVESHEEEISFTK